MKPPSVAVTAVALFVCLAGCVGYKAGAPKPAALAGIEKLHVPMFANRTLEPRVEVLATNATVSALTADGTYQITSAADADAVLEAAVVRIDYQQIRGQRLDTLRPLELQNQVTIEWSLKRAGRPSEVLASGLVVGNSRFFLALNSNVQTARTNALPDAVENATRAIATRLGAGF